VLDCPNDMHGWIFHCGAMEKVVMEVHYVFFLLLAVE